MLEWCKTKNTKLCNLNVFSLKPYSACTQRWYKNYTKLVKQNGKYGKYREHWVFTPIVEKSTCFWAGLKNLDNLGPDSCKELG